MNKLKRALGIAWMLLAPVAIYYLLVLAFDDMDKKHTTDAKIQWIVFIAIFVPIAIGLIIFGYYALKGEYDHLPESSAEISD